jgi:hypothetical protein
MLLDEPLFATLCLRVLTKGIMRAVWVFSLLAWGYVIIDRWVNPQLQKADLSPFVPVPQDVVGILAFVVGFASFAIWGSMEK